MCDRRYRPDTDSLALVQQERRQLRKNVCHTVRLYVTIGRSRPNYVEEAVVVLEVATKYVRQKKRESYHFGEVTLQHSLVL
jgi:hypothetical protein